VVAGRLQRLGGGAMAGTASSHRSSWRTRYKVPNSILRAPGRREEDRELTYAENKDEEGPGAACDVVWRTGPPANVRCWCESGRTR